MFKVRTETHPEDVKVFERVGAAYAFAKELVENGHSPLVDIFVPRPGKVGRKETLNWEQFNRLLDNT